MAAGARRAVIIDDHDATRAGVAHILESAGFEMAGSVGTAAEGYELVQRESPDVCVVAILLPDESGTALVRRIVDSHPGAGVVLYTGMKRGRTLADSLECGARGLVLKRSPRSQLVAAAEAVADGGAYVDPDLHSLLLSRETTGDIEDLTPREREMLDLLAGGHKGVEIAERLSLSPETVRTHIRNAMEKLEARTRAHAVAIVLRQAADGWH